MRGSLLLIGNDNCVSREKSMSRVTPLRVRFAISKCRCAAIAGLIFLLLRLSNDKKYSAIRRRAQARVSSMMSAGVAHDGITKFDRCVLNTLLSSRYQEGEGYAYVIRYRNRRFVNDSGRVERVPSLGSEMIASTCLPRWIYLTCWLFPLPLSIRVFYRREIREKTRKRGGHEVMVSKTDFAATGVTRDSPTVIKGWRSIVDHHRSFIDSTGMRTRLVVSRTIAQGLSVSQGCARRCVFVWHIPSPVAPSARRFLLR